MRSRTSSLLFACLFVGLAGTASAQVFDIRLSGDQQVPVNDSEATGNCLGYLNEAQDQLKVICRHTVASPTAAHIHRGPADEIGPVLFPFDSFTSPFKGDFAMTQPDVDDLLAGNLYVNVHSDDFPGGELRGQIGPAADVGMHFPVEGSQEVPAVTTENSGECIAALNPMGTKFRIGCSHNVADVSGAHIHNAPAGTNGPIIFFFDPGTTIIDEVSAAAFSDCPDFEDFLNDLRNENLYVNIHSPSFPSGELRGQIPRPGVPLYFSQFGNGGGFTSSITLINSSTTTALSGTLYFKDIEGNPLPVGLAQSGVVGAGFLAQSADQTSVDFAINPLGGVTVETDGQGELALGSAESVADGPYGGVIRFSIPDIGIAGLGSAPALQQAIAPVRSNDQVNTAMAVRNNESYPLKITLELLDEDGTALDNGVVEVDLSPNGRIAQFINEIFPDANTVDFTGTVRVSSQTGSFSALALELGGLGSGIFTSLPVTPVVTP